MDPVVDPQTLPSAADQAGLAQLRQMARDRRLGRPDRRGEFTDTEFTVLEEQNQAAQPGLVRQRGKKGFDGYIHTAEYIAFHMFFI